MIRLLLLVLLLVAVYQASSWLAAELRRSLGEPDRRGRMGPGAPSASSRPSAGARPTPPERLAPCAACGAYLPEARGLAGADGRLYCSATCRETGPPV